MRRAHSLLLGLATVALAGGATLDAARAQTAAPTGEARGLRYLSWSGRTEPAAPSAVAAAPADVRGDLRRPNRVIPHGGSAAAAAPPPPSGLTPAPGPARQTLTPANAWMRPAAAAPLESATPPQPMAPAPAPVRMAAPAPAPTPPPAPAPARATPDYLPEQGGRGQPVPADIALSAPTPVSDDPMAPRRDAPIFRMQATPPPAPAPVPEQPRAESREAAAPAEPRRVAVVTANPDDRPPPQSSRRYSVHRLNGQEPDALTMPQPTYVDALTVTMTETPASQDLGQPDPAPTMIRDAQGRVRMQPAAPEGDYQ